MFKIIIECSVQVRQTRARQLLQGKYEYLSTQDVSSVVAELKDIVSATDLWLLDFEPEPEVPFNSREVLLKKTGRALIDVHKGELTLRIGSEAITYNLDQTSRYSANYTHMTANKIDVIDMACEEYFKKVLGFLLIYRRVGNSYQYFDPIGCYFFSTLTPFVVSDFCLLEEAVSFLEAILNSEPPLPPTKSRNKIKLISQKSRNELQGFQPEFCTHKIIMEEDYAPAVQHQRRVNPKIHDVIKKEVEKLLEAGLIYPISDSPWVSPIHCVPKKGGYVCGSGNEEIELITTRLVTDGGYCICTIVREDDGSLYGRLLGLGITFLPKCTPPFRTTLLQSCEDTNLSLNSGEEPFLWSKRHCHSAIRFLRKGLRLTKPKSDVSGKITYITPPSRN
ncbi:hypothetical protein Tco_0304521 [Tanacetum coccineum]